MFSSRSTTYFNFHSDQCLSQIFFMQQSGLCNFFNLNYRYKQSNSFYMNLRIFHKIEPNLGIKLAAKMHGSNFIKPQK